MIFHKATYGLRTPTGVPFPVLPTVTLALAPHVSISVWKFWMLMFAPDPLIDTFAYCG
ncbi:Uncharacterised protein [Burkholderia cenocepacia]|nr:Uncharacterised protein [Burkholderia cenocepacia]